MNCLQLVCITVVLACLHQGANAKKIWGTEQGNTVNLISILMDLMDINYIISFFIFMCRKGEDYN